MQRKGPLFQPGDALDLAYRNLRDAPHCVAWKAYCESLWERFRPYADDHFLEEARRQFHPRFWEMYLTVAFLDRGFELRRHRDGGPEFGIDIEGRRYWFDAIAPTSGEGPDAVPDDLTTKGGFVPTQKIILRYTSALATKREKWKKDLARGRVSASDGYIVAINDRGIDGYAWAGGEMPYVVKALYGLGDIVVSISLETNKIVDSRHAHRPTIAKASGTGVSSQSFVARECPEVSAVLYSSVNAANYPQRLGDTFMILHNCEPTVPLPRASLKFAREYAVDGEHLAMTKWAE